MSPEANGPAAGNGAARRNFHERTGHRNPAPLWLSLAELVTPEPRSPCRPASWRLGGIRAAMMEAGGLITATEAERRGDTVTGGIDGLGKITLRVAAA